MRQTQNLGVVVRLFKFQTFLIWWIINSSPDSWFSSWGLLGDAAPSSDWLWMLQVHVAAEHSKRLHKFEHLVSTMSSFLPQAATNLKLLVRLVACLLSAYKVQPLMNSILCSLQLTRVLAWFCSQLLSLRIWLNSFSLNTHMRPLSMSSIMRPYCSHTSSCRTCTVLSKICFKSHGIASI